MNNSTRFAIVVIIAALVIPSMAEADRRKRRRPANAALHVAKWWPQSGPVGTTVNITGTGFGRGTQLLIGGNVIRPRRLSARRITFVVPEECGDGSIILRRPAARGDYDEEPEDEELEVGTYAVVVPDTPKITNWSPRFGGPGTIVRIEGKHFDGADVFWGNKRLRIANHGNGWVEVAVPRRARRNEVFSVRSRYGKDVTRSEFELYQAAHIDRLSARRAKYGQTVIIQGRNFPSNAEVFWGDVQLNVSKFGRRGRRLWIEIPDDIGTGTEWIHVHDGRGKVRSPVQLEIYEDAAADEDDGY